MKILLASGSPRRAKILSANNVEFDVIRTDAREVSFANAPERTVMENALAKGSAARRELVAIGDTRQVLSADTIVWLDGKIYGKPRDVEEARMFLRTLSGRTHYVFTGVAFDGNVAVQTSAVTFRDLSDDEIASYVARANPLDRAGAYDIDTNGDFLVASFSGSYENIMGLPLEPLRAWGIIASKVANREKDCREKPVGFFDSGLGGLTILEAFKKICPNEPTVYLADSVNCPYGVRTASDVLRLSRDNVRILREAFDCKMIVVACNTATAAAIDELRRDDPEYPFVGIEPAIKPAALNSKTGIVGVLATAGTFNGRLYRETKEKFAKDVEVLATVADEFVDFVERHAQSRIVCSSSRESREGIASRDDFLLSREAEKLVRTKIEPLLAAGCDTLVLGCTHFPHLAKVIEKVVDGRASLLDSSVAVARQAANILATRDIASKTNNSHHIFLQNRG